MSTEDSLQQIVEMFGLDDLPSVAVIRSVSPEEFTALFDSCMSAAGFNKGPDGGYSSGDQGEAMGAAIYTCTAQYPIDDRYTQPLTDAQMSYWYAYLVDEAVPCYQANGWPIESWTVPSEASFVATFGTSSGWAPYLDPPADLDPVEVERIQTQVCPLFPPAQELYSPELLDQ